ncbi:2-amino-4-hydroxy-6-hydroxymethyldihydropteridine diphosphokinase [Cryobacterium frigoriphilum]|uniref:2-amino-4-hydroxy-6-hydroxymethyldihydropteridine diphosphokinase n=1 Tax=Cryobacterium frigoriphilum TaxID=1259150 RepID=A0A4R9AAL0_9MICO|nr:2-amino-4-hydroxy-6-hydroxymethyldihydropteridine diphosphokinase [Cryobacterium frigoriphilum]TFD54409.1 2-amino-4-hydroxy-6-hydroxymethyldihydropteridine diphosphokinase [Cryobacterium frigoriphilum]
MSGPAALPAAAPVILALGSNLGDRAATLIQAVQDLFAVDGLELSDVSPLWESAALKLDGVDAAAPRYLNGVVAGSFAGDPLDLLAAVNSIEADHGRVRAERWGDRTLDIDIIVIGDLVRADARLTLPHPLAHARDFVLAPWLDVDPDAVLPGRGPVRDLLAATEQTARRYTDTRIDAPPRDAPPRAAPTGAAALGASGLGASR